jgi:DUSAM domain-containing protein
VGIDPKDAEDALRSVATAATFLREISRRIEEGSNRLWRADSRAEGLWSQGDFAGAREALEKALEAEVVPLYREQARRKLKRLAKLEAVATTGHVDATLSPWLQVRVLAARLRQGHRLELRDDLCDFLLHTAAPAVAIGEAEAEKALESVEGAEALLGEMLRRIEDGKQRITQALSRMMDCREAGDREGALQALREVLAVEVVPKYRQMAQENLDGYDEPPPEW